MFGLNILKQIGFRITKKRNGIEMNGVFAYRLRLVANILCYVYIADICNRQNEFKAVFGGAVNHTEGYALPKYIKSRLLKAVVWQANGDYYFEKHFVFYNKAYRNLKDIVVITEGINAEKVIFRRNILQNIYFNAYKNLIYFIINFIFIAFVNVSDTIHIFYDVGLNLYNAFTVILLNRKNIDKLGLFFFSNVNHVFDYIGSNLFYELAMVRNIIVVRFQPVVSPHMICET